MSGNLAGMQRGVNMKKLIGIELVKMKHYLATWLIAIITIGQGFFYAAVTKYASAIASYPKIEYIIYICTTARWICMASLFMTAYVIAGDFSMRTVQNVLSTGVDKKKYYLSRLFAQMIFIFVIYAGGCAAFILSRIVRTGTVNTAMPFWEFSAVFMVMALQPMVYVALANMISIFCKNQGIAIILGELSLFLALVLRIYSMGKDFYTGSGLKLLKGPIAFEPLYLLETCDMYVYSDAGIFSFAFFKYAVSALILITITSAIGYAWLIRSDLR